MVGPGLPHYCTPATRRANLLTLAKEETKSAGVVASSLLKTHDSSPNSTVRISQGGGLKLPLKLDKLPIFNFFNNYSVYYGEFFFSNNSFSF